MDWSNLSISTGIVLILILLAEAANGWTDAPAGTSAAVASGALKSRTALFVTAIFNFLGLIAACYFGAAVAKTIGTGIVQPDLITIGSIGVAMITTILWSILAAWLGLPISKTHSLLAALAGIGFAVGGFDALLPASHNLADSGWVAVGKGVFSSLFIGSAVAWFLTRCIAKTVLGDLSDRFWRHIQRFTVCVVASGHGFNDGLKYVGVITLVLLKSGVISEFRVLPQTIVMCAVVMGLGTMLAGCRIHDRLDTMVNGVHKKSFRPYMGVASELTAGFTIWQTGWLGIPMSTTHSVVAAMAGARSAFGKVHIGSVVRILWGWIITYVFCFFVADLLTRSFLT